MSEKGNPDLTGFSIDLGLHYWTSCTLCTYGYSACSLRVVITGPHALCVPTVTLHVLTLCGILICK